MLLKQWYQLGMLGSTFILWNTTELINLVSKNLQKATLGHIASFLGITPETLSRIRADKSYNI